MLSPQSVRPFICALLIISVVLLMSACRTSGDLRPAAMPAPASMAGGDSSPVYEAIQVRFSKLVAGDAHLCALEHTGRVACWGQNYDGQLGNGSTKPRFSPTVVEGIDDAVDLVAGRAHNCVLHKGGGVSCWGMNYAVGAGTSQGDRVQYRPVKVLASGGPRKVNFKDLAWCPQSGQLSGIVSLSAHDRQTCAVHESGAVLCWGNNSDGRLGVANKNVPHIPCPMPIEGMSGAKTVAVEEDSVCATLDDEQLACWGPRHGGGRMEVGAFISRFTGMTVLNELSDDEVLDDQPFDTLEWPEEAGEPMDQVVKSIMMPGQDATITACVIAADGKLFCAVERDGQQQWSAWEQATARVDSAPTQATESDNAQDCPSDLVFGDKSLPNFIRFEYEGRSRTFYFEKVSGYFTFDGAWAGVRLPSLRLDTAANGAPRTDGWEELSMYVGLEDGLVPAGISVASMSEYLGCFRMPPRIYGSSRASRVKMPARASANGAIEVSFELGMGTAEMGRITGQFSARNMPRYELQKVDAKQNDYLDNSFREHFQAEEGLAFYDAANNELLLDVKYGDMHRGFRVENFDGKTGVYLEEESFSYRRFHVDKVGAGRLIGRLDEVRSGEQTFFAELKTWPRYEQARMAVTFDLPLVVLEHPGVVHVVDSYAPVALVNPEPVASRMASASEGERVFIVYSSWDAARAKLEPSELSSAVFYGDDGVAYTLYTSMTRDDAGKIRFHSRTEQPPMTFYMRETEVEVLADAKTLRPIERRELFETFYDDHVAFYTDRNLPNVSKTMLDMQFLDNLARISADGDHHPLVTIELETPQHIFDVTQLLWLIPTLDLKRGHLMRFGLMDTNIAVRSVHYDDALKVFHQFNPTILSAELAVLGEERLPLAGGEVEVLRLELRVSGESDETWVFFVRNDEAQQIVAVELDGRVVIPAD